MPPNYAWADNNQHMDPCGVASSLMDSDLCDSSQICTVPPLQPINNSEDTYPEPTTKLQSSCLCSSVIYALVSACSDCQDGRIESMISWPKCSSPLADFVEAPVPADIPAWAYFDVTLDPIYSHSIASSSVVALPATPSSTIANPIAAREVAAAQILPRSTSTFEIISTDTTPSSTIANATAVEKAAAEKLATSTTIANATTEVAAAEILPTSTSTFETIPTDTTTPSTIANTTASKDIIAAQMLPTSTSTSETSLATASLGSDLSSAITRNRTGAIAGGTIAAVVILAVGAALAYWYIRRRRRTREPPSVAYMKLHGLVY